MKIKFKMEVIKFCKKLFLFFTFSLFLFIFIPYNYETSVGHLNFYEKFSLLPVFVTPSPPKLLNNQTSLKEQKGKSKVQKRLRAILQNEKKKEYSCQKLIRVSCDSI